MLLEELAKDEGTVYALNGRPRQEAATQPTGVANKEEAEAV